MENQHSRIYPNHICDNVITYKNLSDMNTANITINNLVIKANEFLTKEHKLHI